MGKYLVTFFVIVNGCALFAQHDLESQVPKENTFDESVIDPVYGIERYEPFNFQLEGDSTRRCGGYACEAWVEDYYTNGQLLHKGYYLNGQLKVYKNYYPNGQVEREFKNIDNFRTSMKKYYKDGTLKSEVKYIEGSALEWTDYYPSGQIEYREKYHKSFAYHTERFAYFKDGRPKEEFQLVNKKKLVFSSKEYHDNGQLKKEGELRYDNKIFDFYQQGDWNHYDESGKLVKRVSYNKGTEIKEETF